ncbi:germ cell-expressed bHLH-PAS isoform 1-T7 [Cochliomyia hominivorax]
MCSTMNSPNSDNVQNQNASSATTNFFINDQLITSSDIKFDTDDIPYLSEQQQFDNIVDENKNNFTHIKMDTNDNDELNNALNQWSSSDSGGGGGGGGGVITLGDTTEDELGYQDDNVSHVGSDYSEFQPADHDNIFAQPNPPELYGAGDLIEPDIKYNPVELMLRPPSGSAMHFNYNFPAIPSQTETPANLGPNNIHHRNATVPNNSQLPFLYGSQQTDMNGSTSSSSSAATAAAAAAVGAGSSGGSGYTTNTHSNPGNFHPNMWYPNAPFGTYRSYGSHTYGRHYGPQLSHDHMMDMFQLSNSGREARNRAEKNRRDKLNGSIQELSTMVPHVAESPRRVDKTAVLRFAAHGLRLKYVFGKSFNNESTQTTDALMKLLDSFFLTLTCNGQIVLVSSSIEQHLGHCQADLYGQNILHITHPEDHPMLKEKLIPTDLDNLLDIQPEDESGEPRERTPEEENEIDRRLREDKRSFTIRLARSGPRSEPTVYELVKIDGSFRRSDMAPRGLKTSTFPSTLQLMRRSRGREDIMPLHTISGNDIVLIAIARIVRPPVINRAVEANRLEYKTRHLIDGRIIDCDQRISLVAGYMTDEVRNLSPFTFMHQDDVRWVIVALRQMYDCNSSYGESTYRLFTRNGKIIYLHTKGFLEIDKNTNKVHSFICVNTLLDEEEGKRRVEYMKNKFSVIINTKIPQSSDDVPASENPQQLEKAVLCLIQNLKSVSDEDNDSEASSSFSKKSHHHHHQNSYQHYGSSSPHAQAGSVSSIGRSTKTPPLALVPPAPDSIKNSITKSVSVVKTTAGKFLRSTINNSSNNSNNNNNNSSSCSQKQQQNVPDDSDNMIYSNNPADSELYHRNAEQDDNRHYTASGAVKRKISYSISETDSDEYRVPMQRQAIENVLSNSLQQINNRLNQQLNTAMELRDQSQRYEVPHSEERIADIMKEHQEQQEMYINITNEFEVQRKNSESSSCSDNEIKLKTVKNGLEDQLQQLQNQDQQQINSTESPTNCSGMETEAQLKTENNLQL